MFTNFKILKEWKWDRNCYTIVKTILGEMAYKELSSEYKLKVEQAFNRLLDMDLDFFDLKESLLNFWKLFHEEGFAKENFYDYLDILLAYPTFPLFDSSLLEKDMLTYLKVEARLCFIEEDFIYCWEEFEEIIKNETLRKLGLTDIILNGIINTHLPKYDLVSDISYLLAQEEDYTWLILKLFQAPTADHNYLVFHLLEDKEVRASGHLLEMVDMIYATFLEDFNELEFKITHKLIYQEMTFKDACRNYCDEAMKLLDESKEMKSTTLVRVPIYMRR